MKFRFFFFIFNLIKFYCLYSQDLFGLQVTIMRKTELIFAGWVKFQRMMQFYGLESVLSLAWELGERVCQRRMGIEKWMVHVLIFDLIRKNTMLEFEWEKRTTTESDDSKAVVSCWWNCDWGLSMAGDLGLSQMFVMSHRFEVWLKFDDIRMQNIQ